MVNEPWWFFQPGNVLLLLIVLAWLSALVRLRRLAGFLLFLALLFVVVPAVTGVGDWLGHRLESMVEAPAELPGRVDGIIILGGSVDWKVTRDTGRLSLNAAGERMAAGAALARLHPEAELVLTGIYADSLSGEYSGATRPESLFAGPEFAGRKVTFIGEATSTYEEGLLTLEQIEPAAGSNWLLVTSALHMPRAAGVFQTLGWNVIPWPVDYRSPAEPRLVSLNLNFSAQLSQLDYAVREWAAYLIYRRSGRSG